MNLRPAQVPPLPAVKLTKFAVGGIGKQLLSVDFAGLIAVAGLGNNTPPISRVSHTDVLVLPRRALPD